MYIYLIVHLASISSVEVKVIIVELYYGAARAYKLLSAG